MTIFEFDTAISRKHRKALLAINDRATDFLSHLQSYKSVVSLTGMTLVIVHLSECFLYVCFLYFCSGNEFLYLQCGVMLI